MLRAHAVDALGFDACGVADARQPDAAARLRTWLAQGYGADMAWLERHQPLKEDPAQLLPGVHSAVVVMKHYKNTPRRYLPGPHRVARYAAGRDYHAVLRRRLGELESFLAERVPGAACYGGVDSRPLNERAYALAAGLGFRGRNSMVIRPGLGSYTFLGVLLTTAALAHDRPIRTHCGTCRACVDACPTDAILEDGTLDARRCISYLTIERKAPLPPDEAKATLHGWIFGCDICQEVCPFNRDDVPLTDWPALMPEAGIGFDAFARPHDTTPHIPRRTPLHRSRKLIRAHLHALRPDDDNRTA